MRLSALIVNYDSGGFALACAQSLSREWRRAGREAAALELVVVDNASPKDQTEWLERLAALGAQVVRAPENLGYARGMNLALARSNGSPSDAVAVLNPDLHFLPGSLAFLLERLAESENVGAVAPRTFVDPPCAVQLPPNAMPSLAEHWRTTLAQMSPASGRAYSAERTRRAIEWWTADRPFETEMLSGACLFLRRETIARLGSLFDERYPLYYEDTDLFRRLAAARFRLIQEPRARVLHHWARSTGVGERFAGEPLRRYGISQRAFMRRWHGALGSTSVALADALFARWPHSKQHRPIHDFEPLGAHEDPVEIVLSRRARFVLELSLSPTLLLAAGILGDGERWSFLPQTWEWFFQGPYFLRAVDRESGELLGAWTFEKTSPPRARPLIEESLPAHAIP